MQHPMNRFHQLFQSQLPVLFLHLPLTLPPRSAAIAEDIMFAGPPRRNPVIGIIIINKCIDGVPKNGTNAPEDNSNMTTTTGALELYLSLIQP